MKMVGKMALALGAAAVAGCSQAQQVAMPVVPPLSHAAMIGAFVPRSLPPNVRAACGEPAVPGVARCIALVRTDAFAPDAYGSVVPGYGPADLQAAYKLPSATAGKGATVAIVDAFDDPSAEVDLVMYRSHFGLPLCTTRNGCFRKVNELGRIGPYPAADAGWAQEVSLDLDMVSAVCPNCRILLVEARSANFNDLAAAIASAARLGAVAISNSYGSPEFAGEGSLQAAFAPPGIAVTASSGDSGYGPQFPAAAAYVTAVGGTTLRRAANARGFSETAWANAGSGCSAYIPKPPWQHDAGCARRTISDVAAVADPNTGVAVYESGWWVFGGTSAGAPIVAAVYALAGNAAALQGAQQAYATPAALFDVTSGSNGSCGASYLCTARKGYDGPTGDGTPDGIGAF